MLCRLSKKRLVSKPLFLYFYSVFPFAGQGAEKGFALLLPVGHKADGLQQVLHPNQALLRPGNTGILGQ